MNILSKHILRERILTLLRDQGEAPRLEKSRSIMDKLFNHKSFEKAGNIIFYASFDGEVHTIEMIRKAQLLGKRIALPKINTDRKSFTPVLIDDLEIDCECGEFGIRAPKSDFSKLETNLIDCVIVPGIAFDRKNNRLGRGGGFYDRFLSELSDNIPTIGLAFDFQMVDNLPKVDVHDVPVSCVISN